MSKISSYCLIIRNLRKVFILSEKYILLKRNPFQATLKLSPLRMKFQISNLLSRILRFPLLVWGFLIIPANVYPPNLPDLKVCPLSLR